MVNPFDTSDPTSRSLPASSRRKMYENESNGQAKKRRSVRVLGFSVSTNTDIVAISAVIISLITILTTVGVDVVSYFRGAVVEVFLPEHVQLLVDDCNEGSRAFNHVGVVVPVTFFNKGKYDDLVVKERLYVTVAKKRMQLYPYRIIRTSRRKKDEDYCVTRKTGEFRATDVEYLYTPLRVAVKSGSAVSREILYIADPVMCGMNLRNCRPHYPSQYIDEEDILENRKMTVELRARFLDDGIKSKKCTLVLEGKSFSYFRENHTVTTICN